MFLLSLLLTSNLASAKQCKNLFDFHIFQDSEVVFSTSNPKKQNVIGNFLLKKNLKASFKNDDLNEINARPINVTIHKATTAYQEGKITVVEDTSLHIEDADIGPLIKWHINSLDRFIGKKAKIEIILAFLYNGRVQTFHAYLEGVIAKPNDGSQLGIDSYFFPKGYAVNIQTLRKLKIYDAINPRLIALEKLSNMQADYLLPPIYNWSGPWQ